MPRTLSHGRTALIVPPCDEFALIEAMATLIEDAGQRQKMGQAARIEAETENTWAQTATALLQLFQQVIANQNKGQASKDSKLGVTIE